MCEAVEGGGSATAHYRLRAQHIACSLRESSRGIPGIYDHSRRLHDKAVVDTRMIRNNDYGV